MKLAPILIVVLAVIGLIFVFGRSGRYITQSKEPELVIYWGNGCSHCEKVKKYITDNQIDSRLKIQLKEVYYNKANQADLEATVKKCPEINTTQGIGVPLAYIVDEGRCLSGDTPIIDFFQQRLGIK